MIFIALIILPNFFESEKARLKARLIKFLKINWYLGADRVNALCQTRNLSRRRIGVDNTLVGCPHHFRLGCLECCSCNSLVTGSDCFFNSADEAANPRTTVLVDFRAPSDLAGRLFSRSCIGHLILSSRSSNAPYLTFRFANPRSGR